jgi:hypothetical protein
MIRDIQRRTDIAEQWAATEKLCSGSHRQSMVGGGLGAVMVNETPPESFLNLPLVLAYSVLDAALGAMIEEGIFSCPGRAPMLGTKMAASRPYLRWANYREVDSGREARNRLAHHAELVSKPECLRFIAAVEEELREWAII